MTHVQAVQLYGLNDDDDLVPLTVGSSGSSTIHNYFPDGAVTNADLIDTGDQDYDQHVWQPKSGSETLSFVAAHSFFANSVQSACPGEAYGEGHLLGILTERYTSYPPAGLLRIGFNVWSDLGGGSTNVPVRITIGGTNGGDYRETMDVNINGAPQRYVISKYFTTPSDCWLNVVTRDPGGGTPEPLNIFIAKVMFTLGNPFDFRDGDSDGWSWTGTPYASPSSGPQP